MRILFLAIAMLVSGTGSAFDREGPPPHKSKHCPPHGDDHGKGDRDKGDHFKGDDDKGDHDCDRD
jgi:hypothetical protein